MPHIQAQANTNVTSEENVEGSSGVSRPREVKRVDGSTTVRFELNNCAEFSRQNDREEIVLHCEAELMDEQLRKILTSLYRLHDRLQVEIQNQRRASLRVFAEELRTQTGGINRHIKGLRPRSSNLTSPSRTRPETSRHRSQSAAEGSHLHPNSTRDRSSISGVALSASPAYGWVLLRRINIRVEKIRILCGLAEEKMMLIETYVRNGGDGVRLSKESSRDMHYHPRTSLVALYDQLGILSNLIRAGTRSIADFEKLEAQAIEILSSLR